jgi:AP2-associated kinase
MRRGRPKHAQAEPVSVAKPAGNDPFAALDSKDYKARVAAVDELSQKFPSLDEFSLLHDQSTNYQFTSSGKAAPVAPKAGEDKLKQRVTQALADEAFAAPQLVQSAPASGLSTSPPKVNPRLPQHQLPPRSVPDPEYKPSSMISTGVQTSPSPLPSPKPIDVSQRPIWRVPSKSPHDLSSRTLDTAPEPGFSELPPRPEPSSRRHFFERNRTKSQVALNVPKASTSSRPSLDGQRPSVDKLDSLEKSRSASANRSSNNYVDSNLTYLRDAESSPSGKRHSSSRSRPSSSHADNSDQRISSGSNFRRSMESSSDERSNSKKSSISIRRRSSGNKSKRSSIPSISLSGTKNLIAGRFGDAFRRFESDRPNEVEHLNTPLSPITASSDHHTDDESSFQNGAASNVLLEDEAALSPEVRRELERQRLSAEERRVAAAQAEYRSRLGSNSGKTGNKASTIQNRVRNLLDGGDSSGKEHKKTAEGYGRFTDGPIPPPKGNIISKKPLPASPVKPAFDKPLPAIKAIAQSQAPQRTGPKIAPKPVSLRTGTPPVLSPTKDSMPSFPAGARAGGQSEDWEADFAKRFPSLSGIEMVEREIEARGPVRDV